MPNDYGHEYADKELKSLEKRITKEYKQAAKEVEKKMNDYLAKFADKDAQMKKRLGAGEITASEYAEWRMRQMFTGDRWKAMSETLSADLVNVDKIAAGMINDSLPSSYAENFNYGTYEVESGANMSTSFALYDKNTVANLMKDDPKIIPKANVDIPKDMVWNKRKIISAVTQGILQGEAIPKIARRLQSVTDMDRRAAIRNARTYTTAAENKGRIDSYDRAKELGINVKKEWLATLDERTRMEHRHLDGMAVDNDEPFEVDGYTIMYPGDPSAEPEMIYNCFIGDTSAYTNCDVVRSYAHQYDGDLIEIKTASGVNFTCTPNHPILTLNGWVSAASLHNGDDLLVTRIGNKFGFGRYCNIQHVFSSMKAFHDSFKRNGTIEWNAALCVNFHGDIPTSEVEIVTQKRFLSNNGYPSFCESIKKFLLKLSDKTLFCKCTFMEHFRSVWLSTLGDIRSRSKLLSFLKRHLGHSEVHRLRPIALFDASGVKPLQNDVSGNIERISDCLNGFSGIVFADNIVNVNISSMCTHVYNLQTENGYYFVNSIISQKNKRCNGIVAISHNCRCTIVARIADYKYNDERNDSKLGDMTYEEWKHAKDKEKPAEEAKQEEKAPQFEFTPAKTIAEAEEYAKTFVDDSRFGSLGISYKGIGLDVANEINRTIGEFYAKYNVDKFGGIVVPKGNSKLGKLISSAYAAYSPVRHSFLVNNSMKSVDYIIKHLAEENDVIKRFLAHPENFDTSKMSKTVLKVLQNSAESGRGTVPENIREIINHELGHSLEKQIKNADNYEQILKNMEEFAPRISGYSTESFGEYIAESFCSYQKGEGIVDDELIKAFKSLER